MFLIVWAITYALEASRGRARMVWAYTPLWALAALVPVSAAWSYRRVRRHKPGECRVCRYDLAGLPIGVACPECGAEPKA